jgi:hypothetical protein
MWQVFLEVYPLQETRGGELVLLSFRSRQVGEHEHTCKQLVKPPGDTCAKRKKEGGLERGPPK